MKRLVIGTRGSKLALIQTRQVAALLQQRWPACEIAIEQIHTTGDAITHLPLTKIGGDGVFVLEIERALADHRIDLAVHSLKDVPTTQPPGLRVFAVGEREDARDVLIYAPALLDTCSPADLASGASLTPLRVGTCSLRRSAQIRALFPHADILPLRGNVDTRLRKLDAGDYDAIVLAAAGLVRLNIPAQNARPMNFLPLDKLLPAPGQGALAIEIRDEPELLEGIAPLRNPWTEAATTAERQFMQRLGAGCYLPIAAYAHISTPSFPQLALSGLVISLDGRQQVRVSRAIPWTPTDGLQLAAHLGTSLAEEALEHGAEAIIRSFGSEKIQEQQHV